jgi:hypothetical protein
LFAIRRLCAGLRYCAMELGDAAQFFSVRYYLFGNESYILSKVEDERIS